MSGFAKLFSSITESSIWVQDDKVLRVWIAMLARANSEGIVEGSVPGFAHLCRMPVEEFARCIETLSAPDPYSRTPDYNGRRIMEVPGGWKVLNYLAYRDRGQGKEGSRAPYMRRYRQRKHGGGVTRNNALHPDVTRNTEAEGEAVLSPPPPLQGEDGGAEVDDPPVTLPRGFPKTAEEALAEAALAGCPEEVAMKAWHKAMSRGGRDAKDVPIRNFRSYLSAEASYDRSRQAEAAARAGRPAAGDARQEAKRLREAIQTHPANAESIYHAENVTEEQRADLAAKRRRLRELESSPPPDHD